MSDDLTEVYMKLDADRQACSSFQGGTEKSDTKVTRRSPSAATNAAEDAAFDNHKELLVDTYKSAESTKDKCTEPPSYGLTVQSLEITEASTRMGKRNSAGMEEKNSIMTTDLSDVSQYVNNLHGRSGVRSDGPSTVYNSSELAVVAKEDASRSKYAGPVVGSILGASVLVLMAMFFFAWCKKRTQKKAEKDEEKLERGPVESMDNKAGETEAVASVEYILEP
jgi:hypothetical protein